MISTKYYHRLSHINDNGWNNQIWAKDHAHIDIRWHCAIQTVGSAVKIGFILFFEIRQKLDNDNKVLGLNDKHNPLYRIQERGNRIKNNRRYNWLRSKTVSQQ